MILRKEFRFEASHRLPFHQGKCARLHGHSWTLEVEVEGPVDPLTGMVMDFADINSYIDPVVWELDHHHLGTWEGMSIEFIREWGVPWLRANFNATCENLLWAIAERLSKALPWSRLVLHETCTSEAALTKGEFLKGRKEAFNAEAALSRNLP